MKPANQPFGRHIVWRLPVAYVESDLGGKLTFVNEAACTMQGQAVEELVGRDIWEFLPHDEVAGSQEEFAKALRCGEDPAVIRRPIFGRSGHFRNYELHRRLMRDDDGRIVGICMALFDVSEAEHAHWEASQAKNWLECVVHAIPKAVMVTDALGFVRYVNPVAEELTCRKEPEMTGRQVEKCLPILRTHCAMQAPLSFRMALHEPWSGLVDIGNAENETLTVHLSASPILDKESGHTSGVVILFERVESPCGTTG
jgi:PAS domain S-box-containing protein